MQSKNKIHYDLSTNQCIQKVYRNDKNWSVKEEYDELSKIRRNVSVIGKKIHNHKKRLDMQLVDLQNQNIKKKYSS